MYHSGEKGWNRQILFGFDIRLPVSVRPPLRGRTKNMNIWKTQEESQNLWWSQARRGVSQNPPWKCPRCASPPLFCVSDLF